MRYHNLEIEKKQKGLIPKLLSIITKDPSRFISTMLIGNSFALVIYGLFMGQFIVDNLSFLFLPNSNKAADIGTNAPGRAAKTEINLLNLQTLKK